MSATSPLRIDLNADLGETIDGAPTADDVALFAVISSANVACGGHAGDAASMREAIERSILHDVAVGGHPSYPDRANFGRVRVALAGDDLRAAVRSQLSALIDAGAELRYVKPHGALYHAVREDREQAHAVAAAVADVSASIGRVLPLLGQPGEIAEAARAAGLGFFLEAYLDRGYLADGALVPRGAPGALLHDADVVAARAVRLVVRNEVEAHDGTVVSVAAASLCLHGDSPGAVSMARAVRAALDREGIEVCAPW